MSGTGDAEPIVTGTNRTLSVAEAVLVDDAELVFDTEGESGRDRRLDEFDERHEAER